MLPALNCPLPANPAARSTKFGVKKIPWSCRLWLFSGDKQAVEPSSSICTLPAPPAPRQLHPHPASSSRTPPAPPAPQHPGDAQTEPGQCRRG